MSEHTAALGASTPLALSTREGAHLLPPTPHVPLPPSISTLDGTSLTAVLCWHAFQGTGTGTFLSVFMELYHHVRRLFVSFFSDQIFKGSSNPTNAEKAFQTS